MHMPNHIANIYNQIAEDYAATYDCIESPDDMIFPDTFLKHLAPNSHIVDLGCGTGFTAEYFQKHGMTVEGVDFSASMITLTKRNYPDIPFYVEDMRAFEPSQPVDAVWAGYCLFHLTKKDCETIIKNIRDYLKPGGIFGLVLQEGDGEIEADEPFLPGEKIYIHLYTKEQIKKLLKGCGFTIIDERTKPPLNQKEFSYNKLLLIAR